MGILWETFYSLHLKTKIYKNCHKSMTLSVEQAHSLYVFTCSRSMEQTVAPALAAQCNGVKSRSLVTSRFWNFMAAAKLLYVSTGSNALDL